MQPESISCVLGLVLASSCLAVDLPVTGDFESDTIGAPPPTGGPHQPSYLYMSPGTSLIVEAGPVGLGSRAMLLDEGGTSGYLGATYTHADVFERTLRVEVTVSFDELADGYFLQTARAPGTAVASRLWMNESGEIRSGVFSSGVVVGHYEPRHPIRIRMDLHPSESTYDVTIDADLDGFDEDNPVVGLPFLNEQLGHTPVDDVVLSLNGVGSDSTMLAYDDLEIRVLSPQCPADLDGDGQVNAGDLAALMKAWGTCPPCAGDLDGDGSTGFTDLLLLLYSWGDCGGG